MSHTPVVFALVIQLLAWSDQLAMETGELQGKWEIVSVERQKQPDATDDGELLIVTGNEVRMTDFLTGKAIRLSLRIDPTKVPKQIDMRYERDGIVYRWTGIYELKGDGLVICVETGVSPNVPKRPTEFLTREDREMLVLIVLSRRT